MFKLDGICDKSGKGNESRDIELFSLGGSVEIEFNIFQAINATVDVVNATLDANNSTIDAMNLTNIFFILVRSQRL